MSDATEQIKEKLDIAEFVRQYVPLSPAGKNLKGLCPFHKEKTPSFIVTPDRQIWHCFGCGVGGDVFAFLMRYENLEFIEALKILGEKAGVDIGRVGTGDQKQANILYEINVAAKEFYKKSLPEAGQAVEYLKARGLKGETAKEFEIGFAPDSSDALIRQLTGLGYSMAAIEKAGLAIKTDHGTYRDRFWNRIMFPLHNAFGKCVGFTGRIAPWVNAENVGKYVNSPETPIFIKSKLLYGLDKSKNAIRETKTAILVEGQMDLIMAWQDGVKNIVATSGTAFTPDHLRVLRRVAETLVLIFDQDEPGRIATERTIDLAGTADFNVKVVEVPKDLTAKDPADIALARPGLLATLVVAAEPAMDFYFSRYNVTSRKGDWKKNIRAVLAKLKFMASPVERAHWLGEFSARSGIDHKHLVEEMDGLKIQTSHPERSEGSPEILHDVQNDNLVQPQSRKDIISQRIATLVLTHPGLNGEFTVDFADLSDSYRNIISHHFDKKIPSLPPELQPLADILSLRSGVELTLDPNHAKIELAELFRQLKLENRRDRRRVLGEQINQSEKKGGEPSIELLSEFSKIAGEIRDLESRLPF